MKVKIKGKTYDSDKEPIMLILSQDEKANISNMRPCDMVFCAFPSGRTMDEVIAFMGNTEEPPHLLEGNWELGPPEPCEHKVVAYGKDGKRYCADCGEVLP
jgi:hypothetical protein